MHTNYFSYKLRISAVIISALFSGTALATEAAEVTKPDLKESTSWANNFSFGGYGSLGLIHQDASNDLVEYQTLLVQDVGVRKDRKSVV